MAGDDSGRVLGSPYAHRRRTTDTQPLLRSQQQGDLITICSKTAVALATEGLCRLSNLFLDIFKRNGQSTVAISPQLTTTTTKK